MSMKDLSALIKQTRERNRLTQSQVAAQMPRLSQKVVSDIETNMVYLPAPEILRGIGNAIGLPYAEMLAAAELLPLPEESNEALARRLPLIDYLRWNYRPRDPQRMAEAVEALIQGLLAAESKVGSGQNPTAR
ncbi:MAG: hypothetical protein DLM69_11320 [Candidatus Chloroheliales bacterium]|nr:MAG: hypothetical protein DLM69_11320 [Chloroflexota bacterium]